MYKLHEQSQDLVSSGLDLFHVPGTNVGVLELIYKEFLPLNPLSTQPYTFSIPVSKYLIDLSTITLETSWKLELFANDREEDWKATDDDDDVSTVQMFGATWIRNIILSCLGRELSNSNDLYSYKALMNTLLTYDFIAKYTHLNMMGYHEDDKGIEDVLGTGFKQRRDIFTYGKRVQFITNLDLDLFNQDRYFLNNVPLNIEIYRNTDNFLAVAPNLDPDMHKVRFILQDMRLRVGFAILSDNMMSSLNATLERREALYPHKRTEIRSIYLEPGRTEINTKIFSDTVPRRIFMGMVPTPNYNGRIDTSPFNFQPFDIRRHYLMINGKQYPNYDYEMDFDNNICVVPYYEMIKSCGFAFSPHSSNGITLEDFKEGWTLFAWDLTTQNVGLELVRIGATQYYALFRTPIPAGGVTMIFIAEYDSIIGIGKEKLIAVY